MAIALFWLLPAGSFHAQENFDFIKFSTADGLPSNYIQHVCADREGFLWVNTSGGLARFDGRRFVTWNELQPSVALPLPGEIRLMYPDSRGFLWIPLAESGLYRIDLATLRVRVFQEDFLKIEQTMFPAAWEDHEGKLWLTARHGLARYHAETERFAFFPFPQRNVSVSAFCPAADGNLWVMTGQGLYHFDLQKKKWTFTADLASDGSHVSLTPDPDGTLWIGDWYKKSGGFVHYDPQQRKYLRSFSARPELPDSLPSTDFQGVFPQENGLWLATNDRGLVFFDKRTQRFQRFQPDTENRHSFSAMQANGVTKDIFGNLWVATSQFLDFAAPDPKFITLLDYKQGLVFGSCQNATLVAPDKLVFGTSAGLSIYDRRRKTFLNVHLPAFNQNTYNDQVMAAAPCDATSCWVMTWSTLTRIDIHTGEVLEYFVTNANAGEDHPEAAKHYNIRISKNLQTDAYGNLWLDALHRMVKFTHRGPARQFTVIDTLVRDNDPLNDRVLTFLVDGNRLLIGTENGLVSYDIRSGRGRPLPLHFPGEGGPVPVRLLEKSKDGSLLAVAGRGLFRLNPDRPEQPPVAIPIPYPDFSALGIIEDDAGYIWLSEESGLARFSPDGRSSTFYEPRYQLQNNFSTSWYQAIAKDPDGNLYFPGSAGVSVIRPGDIVPGGKPAVRIVSIAVNNQPLEIDTVAHRKQYLRLAHDQNNLRFGFSAFNSAFPALNRFAYRLAGNAGEWIDLNTQSELNLINLRPGHYTLYLRGANSAGIWSDPVRLTIRIRPPWWNTTWAYLLYLALLAGAGWVFYHFRFRQRLAQREALRLQELDAFKSRFFTNITHEFRTPLTVILGLADQGVTSGDKWTAADTQRKMGLIRRNGENLLRLINQILDLAKLEFHSLKIDYVRGDVLPYLRYTAESLHSFANARNVLVRVESRRASIVMDYDPERLLQIVHNLVSNAIKFTPDGGRVRLVAEVDSSPTGGDWLTIDVIDTGVGIPPEDLPKLFDRFYQAENQAQAKAGGTGIGLSLTRELVKAMGGEITVASTPGMGSTFSVKLPVTHRAPLVAAATVEALSSPAVLTHQQDRLPGDAAAGSPELLIVEDNPEVVEYLSSCLAGEYRISYAYNGRAGVEKAIETIPDLIVSDVMMPEKDGLEVCDLLKNDERTSHIPIVLLTAKADLESRLAGLKRGADAYLAKPFHADELVITLQNLLAIRRNLRAKYQTVALTSTGDAVNASLSDPEQEFLQKLHQAVEARLGDAGLNAEDICRVIGMGRSNLYAKLSALTGFSFNIYVRKLRLARARALLANSHLNVSEVAYEVGFKDPKYFSRVFAEEFGMPPSEAK